MEGMTSIPIQSIIGLPDINIDLTVVEAKLWVKAGADMRLSMQFDKGTTIGAGMIIFLKLVLKLENGLSLNAQN